MTITLAHGADDVNGAPSRCIKSEQISHVNGKLRRVRRGKVAQDVVSKSISEYGRSVASMKRPSPFDERGKSISLIEIRQ